MIEILDDYLKLKGNISNLINKSGYKTTYLAEKMGMPQPSFSVKKQRGNWNDNEIRKILEIIENEELEDFYLGKIMSEHKESEFIPLDKFLEKYDS
jgi:hypothetical protein